MGMVLAHCALIMRNPVFTRELTHGCCNSVLLIKNKKVKNIEIHSHEKSPYMALLTLVQSSLGFFPLFTIATLAWMGSVPL